ncbi:MAG TPA: hypothetical protein DCM10_15840 [Xanthomarina gelatinilytica]|nr:hypothetical protein [Xanthomarina gelatinilytica]|tara:strand:+ start:600 stop:1013 length:414 start_codon:yes stop_codon:yes gene_type:complete
MGFFSWRTSDTNESVSNCHSSRGALPIKVLLPDGSQVIDRDYGGYGEFFDGDTYLDFYELVHELTEDLHYGEGDREQGIKIWFDWYNGKSKRKMIAPKIVTIDCQIPYDELPDSKDCEYQGFFYEFWGDEVPKGGQK